MRFSEFVFTVIMLQVLICMIIHYFIGEGYAIFFIIGCMVADLVASAVKDIYGE